jgi:hypothetical protein
LGGWAPQVLWDSLSPRCFRPCSTCADRSYWSEPSRPLALAALFLGNLVVTLGYLLTGHPTMPVLAHLLMHAAAVIHGMEATIQLPPHY